MAKIILSNGVEDRAVESMAARLGRLGITLRQWPTPTSTEALLGRKDLSPGEREEVLVSVDHRFETLKRAHGYSARDLIVIHEDVPGLGDMLRKFDSVHYHEDDEVRYVLAGRGYFGFVAATGEQFLLEVTAGDYINVPARTEHWFEMKDSPRIKAVRYFIDKEGWVPVYTQRERQFA